MICHFAGDFPSSYGNWHASCTLRVSYNGLCQLIVEKWNRLLHPRKHGLNKMGCVPVSDMDTPLTLLHVSVKCPAIYIYGRDMTGPKKKRKEKNITEICKIPTMMHHPLKVKQHKISSFLTDLHSRLVLSLSLSLHITCLAACQP